MNGLECPALIKLIITFSILLIIFYVIILFIRSSSGVITPVNSAPVLLTGYHVIGVIIDGYCPPFDHYHVKYCLCGNNNGTSIGTSAYNGPWIIGFIRRIGFFIMLSERNLNIDIAIKVEE